TLTAAGNTVTTFPGDTRVFHAPGLAEFRTLALEHHQDLAPGAVRTTIKASSLVQLRQTQIIGRVEGLEVYSNAEETRHVTARCLEPTLAEPEKPLIIIKWPDRCELQVGDVVTFYIRYKNQGVRPVTGIIVADSLTTRLEYVPGSARSDRDALFTITPNEADS